MMPRRLSFRATSRLIRLASAILGTREKGSARICILNYHRILESADPLMESEPDVRTFRWQMALLAECFNVMPLHEAIHALDTHTVPPRAVCITFDDGYRSVHDLALPILKEFSLSATVFVSSGYVDEGSMWNDKILNAVRRMPANRIDLTDRGLDVFPIQTVGDRKQTIQKLTETAKYLPPSERSALAQSLEQLAGGAGDGGIMLTREMLRILSQHGIEIGAHTISHPILSSLDDASARYEIAAGKRQLEEITGAPVRFFAYPNGKTGLDFDERHVLLAKEAGFIAAFTTAFGAATPAIDRFQIPRSRPWDSTPLFFGLRLLRWLGQ